MGLFDGGKKKREAERMAAEEEARKKTEAEEQQRAEEARRAEEIAAARARETVRIARELENPAELQKRIDAEREELSYRYRIEVCFREELEKAITPENVKDVRKLMAGFEACRFDRHYSQRDNDDYLEAIEEVRRTGRYRATDIARELRDKLERRVGYRAEDERKQRQGIDSDGVTVGEYLADEKNLVANFLEVVRKQFSGRTDSIRTSIDMHEFVRERMATLLEEQRKLSATQAKPETIDEDRRDAVELQRVKDVVLHTPTNDDELHARWNFFRELKEALIEMRGKNPGIAPDVAKLLVGLEVLQIDRDTEKSIFHAVESATKDGRSIFLDGAGRIGAHWGAHKEYQQVRALKSTLQSIAMQARLRKQKFSKESLLDEATIGEIMGKEGELIRAFMRTCPDMQNPKDARDYSIRKWLSNNLQKLLEAQQTMSKPKEPEKVVTKKAGV